MTHPLYIRNHYSLKAFPDWFSATEGRDRELGIDEAGRALDESGDRFGAEILGRDSGRFVSTGEGYGWESCSDKVGKEY
jgi:hypothetical protein